MEMKGVAAFTLLLAAVHLSSPCRKVKSVLICQDVLTDFEPGCSDMLVTLSNVGEINSTVLRSENLVSITRFISDNTGITRIAENAFGSFLHLSCLNLEGNMLSEIKPSWFRNPAVLHELRLANNRIDSLNESTLDGLRNLEKLMLNKNQIRTIHPKTFSSQGLLSDLDLSENRLMWVSPQVFRSLSSLRFIRLDKNPWNCLCDAKELVVSIKELKSRNQLNESMDVTCETPSLLKGKHVWNVYVCPVEPSTQTHTGKPTLSPATLSSSETSMGIRPTDAPTSSSTGSYVTSPSPGTDSYSLKPTNTTKPSNPGVFDFSSECFDIQNPETLITSPPTDTNYGCTLIAVIAALSVLLFLVCFIALIEIRKRSNKSVMPECPNAEEDGKLEEDRRLNHDQAAGCCENRHTEAVWRSFTRVRAKSAHAVILTSPFCLSEKDKMHFQVETEAPAEVSENPGNKKLLIESGAEKGGRGGIESDHFTTTDTVLGGEKLEGGRNLHENTECVYANTDTVPYLSIGKAQNKPSPDEESATGPDQSPRRRKVLRRISTWPPTAAQWEVRCKEEGEGFAVQTQNVTVTLSDHVQMIVNKMKHHDGFDLSVREAEAEKNQMDSDVNLEPSDPFKQYGLKEEMSPEPVAVKQASFQFSSNKEFKSVESPARNGSSKTDVRKDVKRSATSRPGAENRKAPSGGTSPDDETLLSGNEYAFMDLLHEVAQNNGRWTRERWKQMHVNKQRRQEAH